MLQQEALVIHEQKLGEDHLDTAQSLNDLALLYHYQGKYMKAQLLYQRALVIYERKIGTNNPRTMGVRKNYLTLLQEMKGTTLQRKQQTKQHLIKPSRVKNTSRKYKNKKRHKR
ncbi:tetratricopeptide repeat protein [Ktedonosporobacter rubrisoli]|uniref:Tetratricopeptide repeat protein n=1 Tax=Ktedonosporobacter rubrisoli TaxID=2509675 RepID=A0A4P6K653_KTERU|nr:tetratricopeptide repeat protein [Ktedonosporobacter rubrisoli]QBD83789.1 tetratricopeptide repeat protein [Ktedonosporobacter rubrisoli]